MFDLFFWVEKVDGFVIFCHSYAYHPCLVILSVFGGFCIKITKHLQMVWNRWMLCCQFPYKMDAPTETFPDYGKWNVQLVTEGIKHMQKWVVGNGNGNW